MDELTEVRQLRSGVQTPDRARLAPGRARLLDAASAGRQRRVWARPRLAIVGVVAAVTAVAVATSLLVGGGDTGGQVTPAALTNAELKGMSAAELLARAAEALEQDPPVAEPKAKQWIYTKETLEGLLDQRDQPSDQALTDESWTRYDGEVTAAEDTREGRKPELFVTEADMENEAENGTEEDDGRSPREMYRLLASLPGDGQGALRVLRKENVVADDKGREQSHNDYQEISALLRADIKPPEGLAGLYRALATLPHVEVVGHMVEDAAGRRAVALRYSGNDSGDERIEREWLLDPETYDVLGERMVNDGETVTGRAFAAAVVDRAGERG